MTLLFGPSWVYVAYSVFMRGGLFVFMDIAAGLFSQLFKPCGEDGGSHLNPDELKRRLYEYQSRRVPGIASYLNIVCRRNYGVDCNNLLFTSPSSLLNAILACQRGDLYSAYYVLKIVFLNPLAEALGRLDLSDQLFNLIKLGKNDEFIRLVLGSLGLR